MIDTLSRLVTARPWRVLAVTGVFVVVAVVPFIRHMTVAPLAESRHTRSSRVSPS